MKIENAINQQEDGVTFEQWLYIFKHVLIKDYGFTEEAANSMGDGAEWKDYYNDGCSPAEAAAEDMSHI